MRDGRRRTRSQLLRRDARRLGEFLRFSFSWIFLALGGVGFVVAGVVAYVDVLTESDATREHNAARKEARSKHGGRPEPLPAIIWIEAGFLGLGLFGWILHELPKRLARGEARPTDLSEWSAQPFTPPGTPNPRAGFAGASRWLAVLGLEPPASWDDVRRAYRRLALQLHPDRNKHAGAAASFSDLNRAYRKLRAHYLDTAREERSSRRDEPSSPS